MDGDASFGALLRRHRRRAGLSQEELAAKAYVSTRAISDLERGVNARPRMHTAVALADGLGLSGGEREEFERHARPDDEALAHRADGVAPRARPPATVDSFVEHGTTLDELVGLVREGRARLVTLLGPAGVGKTRLAVEMAHRLDGTVAFVALASLNDASLLAATVGDALDVEHGPTRTHLESLIEHLASRRLTLVLDNLEQIVDAAGDVAVLLRSCPELTIVVTSRVPLRVAGEARFPVPALMSDGGDPRERPGVRLFLERAAGIGRDFGGDLDAVAELCARLDGLPLAIELAAARASVVPPAQMLQHLDQVLDLLGTGRADAPAQHQSLRAALEWSFRLLPDAAQAAFSSLGVFAGSASADAAMAAWDLPSSSAAVFFDLVQTLAEAHLVRVTSETSGHGIRIDLYETARQFAADKLTQSDARDAVFRRVAQWALDLVDRAEPELFGAAQGEWLDRLDLEMPNLRAVGHWLVAAGTDAQLDMCLHLVGSLQRFWDIRSRWVEGAAWLTDVLSRPGGAPANRAKAHKALGVMHRCLGQLDLAEQHAELAVAQFQLAGDRPGMASCLNNQGVIALDRAEYERADALFRKSVAMCEEHGDDRLTAIVLNNLSLTTVEIGARLEAFRWCRRARDQLTAHGNVFTLSWVEDNLAHVLTLAGHPGWAVPIHEQAIRRRLDLGDESGLIWSLEALAVAWVAVGEADRAGRAIGFVAAHRRRLGAVPVPYLSELTERRTNAVIAKVGAERFQQLWAEGAALDPADVWAWFTR